MAVSYQTKEEWLASSKGQRILEMYQDALVKAQEQFTFETQEMGFESEPKLGLERDMGLAHVAEACISFGKVVKAQRVIDDLLFDHMALIWAMMVEGCRDRVALQYILAGCSYRGPDYKVKFTPWWPEF